MMDTPNTLKAIASMMRMQGYRPDASGVEAEVLDNAAKEIERLREQNNYLKQITFAIRYGSPMPREFKCRT